jgi:3-phenylpropionate/trans-cinnamate dioxygenase ferredoxin subunit
MTSASEFLTVAPVTDLPPGERMTIEVGRHWIVIFNVNDSFYAIEDCCTHEEYPLSEGMLDGHAIECAKHGAQFDIRSGEVLAPPAFVPVRTYPVRVQDGNIEISVSD